MDKRDKVLSESVEDDGIKAAVHANAGQHEMVLVVRPDQAFEVEIGTPAGNAARFETVTHVRLTGDQARADRAVFAAWMAWSSCRLVEVDEHFNPSPPEPAKSRVRKTKLPRKAIARALRIAREFGMWDRAEHRAWCMDQMIRALLGGDPDAYEAWTDLYRDKTGQAWDPGECPSGP